MPHQTQDIADHHQGDALDITVTVEKSDGTAKDISNANAIEYYIKDQLADSDANALLTKTLSGGGVTITDATNGKLEISIETGDTSGIAVGSKSHLLRVEDSDGDRVTVFTGSFTVEY